mmetsp:Transcript_4848/g.9359  ORF Transcript_4848/g.9359 Transcript_4848/m.9359 type:complete len:534 (+) Transcript_4848:22-1623(+)|eukprot:CAMPEP_0175129114 /NCGR_PEP_ID=MMETSP0087-20121206/5293_1 /TAXON_ID=136419 /ORGANISM="Unknown Unknown, Strain D1" /LENGTH=533 /DNA_ID=CAMNT_0016411229 /DNA_START=1 /DNA_END=1602 /DNA_ORIENTATION=+
MSLLIDRDSWVEDKERAYCSGCHERFRIDKRRHHCRVCGEVFCRQCSSKTIPATPSPVRACFKCYNSFRKGNPTHRGSSASTITADESMTPGTTPRGSMESRDSTTSLASPRSSDSLSTNPPKGMAKNSRRAQGRMHILNIVAKQAEMRATRVKVTSISFVGLAVVSFLSRWQDSFVEAFPIFDFGSMTWLVLLSTLYSILLINLYIFKREVLKDGKEKLFMLLEVSWDLILDWCTVPPTPARIKKSCSSFLKSFSHVKEDKGNTTSQDKLREITGAVCNDRVPEVFASSSNRSVQTNKLLDKIQSRNLNASLWYALGVKKGGVELFGLLGATCCCMVSTQVKCPADVLFNTLKDDPSISWHSPLEECELIESKELIDPNAKLVYYRTSRKALFFRQRDFLQLITYREEPTSKQKTFGEEHVKSKIYVIATVSTKFSSVPPVPGVTRALVGVSGCTIRPSASSPSKCTFSYSLNLDLEGNVPPAVNQRLCQRQLVAFALMVKQKFSRYTKTHSTAGIPRMSDNLVSSEHMQLA